MSNLQSEHRGSLAVAALLGVTGSIALVLLDPLGRTLGNPDAGTGGQRAEGATPLARPEAAEYGRRTGESEGSTTLARGLRSGDHMEYQFEQRRAVLFQALELPADRGPEAMATLEMTSRGLLSFHVYAEHEGRVDAGFRAAQVKIQFDSPDLRGGLGGVEQLEQAVMSGEVLARVSRGGRVERLAFPSGMGPEARNYWRDTLARWQVVFPDSDAAPDEWTVEEVDGTGTYLARYRSVAPGQPRQLVKTKLTYRSVHGGSGDADLALPTGEVAIAFDTCLLSLTAHEEVVIEAPGFAKRIQTTVDYSFERTAWAHQIGGPRPDLEALEQGSTLADMEGELRAAEGQTRAEPTVASLLEEIEVALEAEGRRSKAVTDRMRQLIELMREDPEAVATTLARLAAEPCSSDLAAVLIGAFGGAASPAAQLALQQILMDPTWGEDRQNMALLSFAQVTNPGPSIDAALLELHEGRGRLSLAALYLLGAVGRQVAGSDRARFLAIQDVLCASSQAGNSLDERISALQAMSNLGLVQVVPEIEQALREPNDELRRASIQALARCSDGWAGELLEQALRTDPAESVRLEAVKAFGERSEPRAAELLLAAARQDPFDEVRLAAVQALASSFGRLVSTRQALVAIARTDRSPDVAAFAQELVAAW